VAVPGLCIDRRDNKPGYTRQGLAPVSRGVTISQTVNLRKHFFFGNIN